MALLAAFALAERRHPAPLVLLPFLARRACADQGARKVGLPGGQQAEAAA